MYVKNYGVAPQQNSAPPAELQDSCKMLLCTQWPVKIQNALRTSKTAIDHYFCTSVFLDILCLSTLYLFGAESKQNELLQADANMPRTRFKVFGQ